MRKAQPGSRAEQYHFGLQREQKIEMLCRELLESGGFPIFNDAIGQYDQILLMAFAVDQDVSGSVAGKYILLGKCGKMQLQLRLHLRRVGGSGNITSFLLRNKVFG